MGKVLVIDDSPTIVAFVRQTLEAAGHEVEELGYFVDLPRHIGRAQPDLVLLDLEMPGMDGQRVGRFIRQLEETYDRERTVVVIFSSRPRAELEEAAREVGAAAAVEKGASPEQLRMTVQLALADRALTERPAAG